MKANFLSPAEKLILDFATEILLRCSKITQFAQSEQIARFRMKTTNVVGSTDLRNRIGQMLDDALAGKQTIIERHGRRIAYVVPYGEYDRLQARLMQLEAWAEAALGRDWEERLSPQEG